MKEDAGKTVKTPPADDLQGKGKLWREALEQLKVSITANLENVSQLHLALEEYEAAEQRTHQELDFLQFVDLQLVQHVFDVHEVMANIAKGVQKLTGASFCDLLLRHGNKKLRVAWATDQQLVDLEVPIEKSITGRAFSTGQPVLVGDVKEETDFWAHNTAANNDSEQIRSELAVPMKDQFGRVFGVVNLESTETQHFTDHHKILTLTLAGQAAIALRNARLYEQFMSILDTFSLIKSEEEGLQAMLSAVGQRAQEMVGAEHCQVLTLFGDELIVAYTTGQEEPGVTRVKAKHSVSGLVVERKAVVRYDDVLQDEEALLYYTDVLGGMRSEIAVPILWKDEVLGVINLESPRITAFSSHDEKLLKLFATQAAVAISNARRIQELSWNRQVQSELWAMAQIGDVYGPFIHRLNSDAGNISALLSEIRVKYESLLSQDGNLDHLLRGIESKAEQILEVPGKLKRQLESARSYDDVDLVQLIEKVISRADAHQGPRITFKKELQSVKPIWTSQQIEDIIENLIRNAVEALPHGGTVVIGTQIWETTTKAGNRIENGVEFYIKDSCGGIPESKLKTLWDFGTTSKNSMKHKHLGFGLWWVKAFVERLGGAVTVHPHVNVEGQQGCQFTVSLPLRSRLLSSNEESSKSK
jgi:GAF domain-containing protein